MVGRYISNYDNFEDEVYLDTDNYTEELSSDISKDWEDFLSWAEDNPQESNYPLRKDFTTDRAYKKALQDWLEESKIAFDCDPYNEELSDYANEDWEDFLNWAKDNPQESNYPLRKEFVTDRAYKKALQDWLEEANIAFVQNLIN